MIFYLGLTRTILHSNCRPLGADYTGEWQNCTVAPGKALPGGCTNFVITVTNVSGAAPPTVPGGLNAVLLESGGLRDYPASAAPSSGDTGAMLGDFGVSGIKIVSLISEDKALFQSGVSVGDTLTLAFSENTDRAGMGGGVDVSKEQVDALFNFSTPLAENYTGEWIDNATFVVTISGVAANYTPPYIFDFTLTMLAGGRIRNYPPTSAPTVTTSVTLTGGWGPSSLYVVSVFGNDADDGDSVYGVEDTINITFNQVNQQKSSILIARATFPPPHFLTPSLRTSLPPPLSPSLSLPLLC
jgi:hypothetical protein